MLLFFFNDTATTEIYTLSLHDALPIYSTSGSGTGATTSRTTGGHQYTGFGLGESESGELMAAGSPADRKSTRLNSSHQIISYAVFCLKKKRIQHVRYATHRS